MTYKTSIRVMDADVRAPPQRAVVTSISTVAPSKPVGSVAAFLCVALFLLSLPTETGAWYWGTEAFASLYTQSVKSVVPQYTLWAILPFAVMLHVSKFGLKYYNRSIGIFYPFLFIGFLSAFQGVFPLTSLRLMIFWSACASVGVVTAGGLTFRAVARLLFYTVLVELILSIILALFFKSAGLAHDPRGAGGLTWRGVFVNHIVMGAMGGWGLVFILFRKHVGWIPTFAMLACSLLCQYEAHAVGPIIATAASLGFAAAVAFLRRTTLPTASKAMMLGLGFIVTASAIVFVMPTIFGALGRDTTLTGRTEIWQLYIPRALERPILGHGPGSFNGPSPITNELFYRLINFGPIRTPHNMYIALLGEAGFLGLAAMLGALFYIAFILPFRSQNLATLVCSAGAMLIMINGLAETDMVYTPSASFFLFITLLAIRGKAPKSPQDQPGRILKMGTSLRSNAI